MDPVNTEAAAATTPQGDPPPQRSSRANALVLVLGAGLLLAALGVVIHLLTTRARDAVVDADFIELTSPIEGKLVRLQVDVGSAVRAGQPLARLQNPNASEADVRQLQTALITARARLEQAEQELAEQRSQTLSFQQDAQAQRQLDMARSSNDLDQLRAELARERKELAFSQRDVKRQEELYRAGAVALNVVDRARTAAAENSDQVRAIEARIRAQTNRVQAASRNLSLDQTRSDTDPAPRLQQARLRLARLQGERTAALHQVQGLQSQLTSAERRYRQQSDLWLEAPINAVVWQLQARSGDSLRPQQKVLRLINCASRWITTYVSESDLKRLRIGSRARIDLLGEDLDLRGQVDLIRSGVGRLSGDDDEPTPLPINLARESQVRVRIDRDLPAPARKLCFVGYSARVIFQ
ncbi:MAG: HlyD family efflux transporter periplasmic adaptor subunit [Cyanobacteriota bacterium]|nr:HlyD family efflux transporter periplasmic adaptor subunit [Cyanobacteriota bacterium]